MTENTLTGLIPSLYAGLDTVSRELVGYIPAVFRDSSAERAALNQAVRYPIAPTGNIETITPAMVVPNPTAQTIGYDTITISAARVAEFGFVGEDQLGLNTGPGYNLVQADMFAQALRLITNEIEEDLADAAAAAASRAIGSPNTPVFADDIDNLSQLGKILKDNGAPGSEGQLVIDTTAGAALRTLYGISTERDWSKAPFQQQGILATPHGMAIRETGHPVAHVGGTADSATTDAAGYAVGATAITLAAVGTGTILAGDLVTFAGDSHQYVIKTGDADVSAGDIVLQEPGLRTSIGTATTALAIVGAGTSPADVDYNVGGVAFYRNAIVLVARAPALPKEGDIAKDRMMMVDPRSGLGFEVSVYLGYRKVRFEVGLVWGVKVAQPRHTALLVY